MKYMLMSFARRLSRWQWPQSGLTRVANTTKLELEREGFQ